MLAPTNNGVGTVLPALSTTTASVPVAPGSQASARLLRSAVPELMQARGDVVRRQG